MLIILTRQKASIQIDIGSDMQSRLLFPFNQPFINMRRENSRSSPNLTEDHALRKHQNLIPQHRKHQKRIIARPINILKLIFLRQHVILQEAKLFRTQQRSVLRFQLGNHFYYRSIVDYEILIKMEPMNADTLVELTKCNINLFKIKQKAVVYSGPCSVKRSGDSIVFKADVNKLEIPRKAIVARLTQVSYLTYLYLHQGGSVYSFSLASGDVLNEVLYKALQKELEVIDYFQMPPDLELRQKITLECPIGQPGAQELGATNEDKLNQIGQGIGNILGGISSVVDLDKVNKESNQAVSRLSKNIFGEGVLSKWQIFKNKCEEVNNKVTDALKPVSQKCKEIASDIGKNFESSDNSFIKNVREYSRKTETALNTGYEKGDAPRRVSYGVAAQGARKPEPPKAPSPKKETPMNNSKIIQEQKLNERKSLL